MPEEHDLVEVILVELAPEPLQKSDSRKVGRIGTQHSKEHEDHPKQGVEPGPHSGAIAPD